MIKIIARQVIKPECLDKFLALAKELAECSNKEPGCITYTSNQNIKDKNIHCFIEQWKDQEAIDLHNKSEHYTRIVPQFAPMFGGEQMVELYVENE